MNMYGEGTDPTPYIFAAYLIGFILIFGYTMWLVRERERLRAYLEALQKDKSS
jgi:CcmD family protein